MSKQNSTAPIESWELTAYLLGELDREQSDRIRQAIDTNTALATELSEIEQTIGLVRGALEAEDRTTVEVAQDFKTSFPEVARSASRNAVEPASTMHVHQSSASKWIALLAMSTCLLVAVAYSSGMLNDWFIVGSPTSPLSMTDSEAESTADELQSKLAEKKEELATEQMARRTAVIEEMVDALRGVDLQQSIATGGNELSSGRLAPSDSFSLEGSRAKKEQSEQDDVLFDSTNPAETSEAVNSGPGGLGGGSVGLGGMGGANEMGGMGMGGMGMGDMGGMGGGMGGMGMGGSGMGGSGMGLGKDDSSRPALNGRATTGPSSGSSALSTDLEVVVDQATVATSPFGVITGAGVAGGEERRELLSKAEFENGRAYDLSDGSRDLKRERIQRHPEANSDRYQAFRENQFELVDKQPLSTFSIDVDTASYAKCRQLLMEAGQLPPANAVRLEEFVNYFDYEYAVPTGEHPFATHLAVSNCPWQPEHRLVRVALQSAKPNLEQRNPANVVFLIDVSGSMSPANKLPLVKDAMRMMIERLDERDRVAMVVYAGAAGCVLEGTSGNQQATILAALDRLQAGGSTNGGDGIQLAYQLARDQFIPGGNNRVVLCTDGDFNVGVTGTEQLVEIVAQNAKSKIFLTVLGFGMGNTNDAMMEQISNRGNGVYGFVDSWREAKRQMVDQLAGNLITVAKDVKIQVEFNPKHIKAYRLLGYENRMLAAKDFNDDTKDAGEIGAGHRVTALYEVVPVGVASGVGAEVDDLLFQPKEPAKPVEPSQEESALADEYRNAMMAVKLRYKQPEGDVSQKLVVPLENQSVRFQDSDRDFRWAASMVQFGMLLRSSQFAGNSTWSGLLEQAREAAGSQPDAQREQALQMMERASRLK